ncbi:MAG: preprotein translocase subunit SecE [Lachnospiraceae bacterium]
MGESAKSQKTSKLVKFWNGVKAEFKKITWPDKDDLLKQSVAVVIISVVVGAIITVLDFGIQYGVDFITTLKF